MPTMIPPTRLVRRINAKRWHLLAEETDDADTAVCGLKFRASRIYTTRNADLITCYDCLSTAVSRKLAERGGAK
jgi:hypothetical protein